MNLITLIIVIVFLVMEVLNVLTLYFSPGSKTANSAGIFKAWEKSKNDPEVHDMVKYLVYWVAGTKVIFISLLISHHLQPIKQPQQYHQPQSLSVIHFTQTQTQLLFSRQTRLITEIAYCSALSGLFLLSNIVGAKQ